MIRSLAFLLTASLAMAESPRVEFALGVLAEIRGDQGRAEEAFEKARLADPLSLHLVSRAVSQRLAHGDRAAAFQLFQNLAKASPESLEVQLAYADFLMENGSGDSLASRLATETLESNLARHPESPAIIQRLHRIYQLAGRAEDAAALLSALDPADPKSALLFAALTRSTAEADEAVKQAKLDEYYSLALNANPASPELARDASDYFRKTDRLDKAIEALTLHITAAPSSLDLMIRLGILHFSAKQDEQGEKILLQVLAIHPEKSLAHQALAKFYRSHDRPDAAREHAAELLKLRGGSPAEFLQLAEEFLAANQPRTARLLLERAVFQNPKDPSLLRSLAIATRRDPETAADSARLFREAQNAQAPEETPDPVFLSEAAEALIAQGQGKAAEESLRAAIKSFPPEAHKETAAALRRLADLWTSENRNADAAKALRRRADSLAP